MPECTCERGMIGSPAKAVDAGRSEAATTAAKARGWRMEAPM
jgi:hypothetical protein